MNPTQQVCLNRRCSASGKAGLGNTTIHSQKQQRYCCSLCGQAFSETTNTLFYNLKSDHDLVVQAIALLAYGCPVQAIVAAFGIDERTVALWLRKAGRHCKQVRASTPPTSSGSTPRCASAWPGWGDAAAAWPAVGPRWSGPCTCWGASTTCAATIVTTLSCGATVH